MTVVYQILIISAIIGLAVYIVVDIYREEEAKKKEEEKRLTNRIFYQRLTTDKPNKPNKYNR